MFNISFLKNDLWPQIFYTNGFSAKKKKKKEIGKIATEAIFY